MSYPPPPEVPYVKLVNGETMPAVGLGTFRLGSPTDTVDLAIDVGYRLFDSAFIHKNEPEIGVAISKKIKEGVVNRDDLFIIGKVRN